MSKHPTFGPEGPGPDAVIEPSSPTAAADMAVTISNDDLLRFVDGALDDQGRVRVLTHLAGHPVAVERVEAYLQQNTRLRSLREHLPLSDSDHFAAPLQAAIVDQLCRRQERRGWRRLAVAAALALAVLGGTTGLVMQGLQGTPGSTAADYVGYPMQAYFPFGGPDLDAAIEPVAELSAESAFDGAAFAWLAERSLDMTFTAPELDRLGLQLVDGAVLDAQGAPAIRAVYQDEAGKPVVLFAGIGKPDVRHAFWLEREGYVSLQWRRGAMIFALVAPTNSPKLSDIVERVGAAVARIPVPEMSAGTVARATVEPPPAGILTVPPPPVDSGPVQAIAVPLARPEIQAAVPGEEASRETIQPEALLKDSDSNAPEAL